MENWFRRFENERVGDVLCRVGLNDDQEFCLCLCFHVEEMGFLEIKIGIKNANENDVIEILNKKTKEDIDGIIESIYNKFID